MAKPTTGIQEYMNHTPSATPSGWTAFSPSTKPTADRLSRIMEPIRAFFSLEARVWRLKEMPAARVPDL